MKTIRRVIKYAKRNIAETVFIVFVAVVVVLSVVAMFTLPCANNKETEIDPLIEIRNACKNLVREEVLKECDNNYVFIP